MSAKTQNEIQAAEKRHIQPHAELTRDLPVFTPETDIIEDKDAITVMANMPGVDEKNVEISLESDVLSITGVQDCPVEKEGFTMLYQGYRTGVFKRQFSLLADIDASMIKAKIADGVLHVVLPKAERAKPQRIAVQAG
ncbi:MAG: hypothetical protein A2X49_11975 [Lentisphaerae bacterium GWF2_52_8]|nr:MAG: hypothetical protein A2X49_11975 [Lentisphaerae bacterium GWF2_52_8]